ncbi:N-methylglutamate dehydrogenase subunit D [Pseudomonas cedrina]|uniref:Sarcosine oxidase n=2 Tax=Pseudomonas cedrina TaxID=651740 RepID=A0A1V2JZ20_PSECE|nr:sarcosine oxidase [Pseudomonas cedrina]ONH50688.1 sarcosine oxidase [Pseudomonas cedrina subsp. cedrina]SDS36653.1 N-methylglutamate dehydrogenase subunit D [Pseudomonas cedrina]
MTRLKDHDLITPCRLIDQTALPRVGFRGTQSAEYLGARGFSLPGAPNQATAQADGSWVARLSQSEYLLLGSPTDQGQRIADEEARWELGPLANYLLPRQDSHACVLLSGGVISQVMAKLCGVDLSHPAFKPGAVAQTSVARTNAIVIHTGSAEAPAFHILWDRASKEYFEGALLDALKEFGGDSLA